MAQQYDDAIKYAAKILFIQRWRPTEIAKQLGIKSARVMYYWAKSGEWENLIAHETIEDAITRRLTLLTEKHGKNDSDYKEFDQLTNQLLKLKKVSLEQARVNKENAITARIKNNIDALPAAIESDLRLEGKAVRKDKRKKKIKNDISGITLDQLNKIRNELFFGYQHRWYENKHQRIRFILKSRQIGATFYFAWEAFEDAILSGDNQIFLSASRKQSEYFKAYIIAFANEYFDIKLSGGDKITLSNGAELIFASTNARTAQGFHGHLYIDEVFWIPDFEQFNKVITGAAAHKKWRKTYISTPSVKSHGAYALWSGEKWRTARKGTESKRREKIEFDLSHDTLKDGQLGSDNIWRDMVTIYDAEKQDCDLFDIEELKDEYTEAEFNQLFMCAFLEAGESIFNLNDLLACGIDSNVVWVDFKTKEIRPFENSPVWLGYDPARTGDKSVVVVVAPPLNAHDKFRVLEKIRLRGGWEYQAARIKELTARYNVQFIGVDCTGPGHGVYEIVSSFFPRTTAIHYGIDTKAHLVLKAQNVIESRRIEWDTEHTDIAQGFLQVRQEVTGNDRVTYVADRNLKTGHADAAWATMHALSNEPLNRNQRGTSFAIG